CRQQNEKDFGKTDSEPCSRNRGGSWNHSSYSVFIGNDSYGCGICKFRYDASGTGSLDYHGSEYRNNDNRTVDCFGCGSDRAAVCFSGCGNGGISEKSEDSPFWNDYCRSWYPVHWYGHDEQCNDAAA